MEDNKCTCEECNCEKDNNSKCNCQEDNKCENKEVKNNEKPKKIKRDKHTDKLNEAYNKISELEDKLLREKAETINYNKRKEQEFERMLKYCNEDLIKDVLPAIDNLERAINMESENDEVKKFIDGVKMVYCNLLNTLEKYEVKLIDGFNKPFDPTYHEAVLTEKKDGVDPGMVIEVLQKGFLYKEKVIRPAMVKVSE